MTVLFHWPVLLTELLYQGHVGKRDPATQLIATALTGTKLHCRFSGAASLLCLSATWRREARLRAHSAMFFEFDNRKIISQRNYDCFEPW